MGKMAAELTKLFDQTIQEKVVSINSKAKTKATVAKNLEGVATFEKLVDQGHDPVHAIYTHTL